MSFFFWCGCVRVVACHVGLRCVVVSCLVLSWPFVLVACFVVLCCHALWCVVVCVVFSCSVLCHCRLVINAMSLGLLLVLLDIFLYWDFTCLGFVCCSVVLYGAV